LTILFTLTPNSVKQEVVYFHLLFRLEAEKYYNFSEFACQLNELEEGVAPTDSRLRLDQRLMEEGIF